MILLIEKSRRLLTAAGDGGERLLQCKIALGSDPTGPKQRQGDGKTPEGIYFVCLKKMGKWGPSLGISYPNEDDAKRAGAGEQLSQCIRERAAKGERPPWGSPLGGEIFIHGGGAEKDWTAGCIALEDEQAQALYDLVPVGTKIMIRP